jgi:hypothetical protein
MGSSVPGLIAAGVGALMILGGILQVRYVDKIVEFNKATSLTKWGARQHTRQRTGCAGFLVAILGVFVIVGGLWAAAAATW